MLPFNQIYLNKSPLKQSADISGLYKTALCVVFPVLPTVAPARLLADVQHCVAPYLEACPDEYTAMWRQTSKLTALVCQTSLHGTFI